jgi:two-component system cell cycle response regulator
MRALVVEDDDVTRLTLVRMLERGFRCEVRQARNGLEGLAVLEAGGVAVALVDVAMPLMDGPEMLEAVRSDAALGTLPVIMISSTADRETVTRLARLGVTDYLLKPLHRGRTRDRLTEILRKLEASQAPSSAPPGPAAARLRALVVDPDPSARSAIAAALGDRFEVDEAGSGADGLRRFLEIHPGLVCVAEKLPLLNETLLARKIRATQAEAVIVLLGTDPAWEDEPGPFDAVASRSLDPSRLREDLDRALASTHHGGLARLAPG